MKDKVKNIFYIIGGILLVCAFVYFMLVEPIISLNNKKDIHTINVDGAFEILELEHSINGLIPIGKDYYYIGAEKGTQNAYIIRAPKKWLEKNFDTDYKSKDSNGFNFTSLAVRISDYEVRDELVNRTSQFEGVNFPIGTEYCLEYSYKAIAIKKLALFGYAVLLAIAGIFLAKNKESVKGDASKVYFVLFIVFLVLMITTLK